MSRIRSKDTSPEKIVRKAIHRLGIGYRLHRKGLPGNPDIVLAGRRIVIFVHGCFWHKHSDCVRSRTPKSNVPFWERKFTRNVERDTENQANLLALGWDVHVVWECETMDDETLRRRLMEIFPDAAARTFVPPASKAAESNGEYHTN